MTEQDKARAVLDRTFERIMDRLQADRTLNITGHNWRDKPDDPALAELRYHLFLPVIEEALAFANTAQGEGVRESIRAEIINAPETADFMAGVPLEAAHQRERWGSDHDAGKQSEDWVFLVGWLLGKACVAARAGDLEKAKHHTISGAAALSNWHAALSGADTSMRPGIDPVERNVA